VAKPFETLYTETDPDGSLLDWEWDPDTMTFTAVDGFGNEYTLKPLIGDLTVDEAEHPEDDS
jgi:hypothetical protein